MVGEEAMTASATSKARGVRRAALGRFVRRAALSSAIATGAFIAFSAPSWADGADAPHSSEAVVANHQGGQSTQGSQPSGGPGSSSPSTSAPSAWVPSEHAATTVRPGAGSQAPTGPSSEAPSTTPGSEASQSTTTDSDAPAPATKDPVTQLLTGSSASHQPATEQPEQQAGSTDQVEPAAPEAADPAPMTMSAPMMAEPAGGGSSDGADVSDTDTATDDGAGVEESQGIPTQTIPEAQTAQQSTPAQTGQADDQTVGQGGIEDDVQNGSIEGHATDADDQTPDGSPAPVDLLLGGLVSGNRGSAQPAPQSAPIGESPETNDGLQDPATPTGTAGSDGPAPASGPDQADGPSATPLSIPIAPITDAVAGIVRGLPQLVDDTVTPTLDLLSTSLAPVREITGGTLDYVLHTTGATIDGVTDELEYVTSPVASTVSVTGHQTQHIADDVTSTATALPGWIAGPVLGSGDSQEVTGETTPVAVPGADSGASTPTIADPIFGIGDTPVSATATVPTATSCSLCTGPASSQAYATGDVREGSAADWSQERKAQDQGRGLMTGTDLDVPALDRTHGSTDTGSGASSGGGSGLSADLGSIRLPGAPTRRTPVGDAWRLPGSISFEPGHSPD